MCICTNYSKEKNRVKKSKSKNIGIVGAGIGGLAVAIRLSLKGHRVTVYEAGNDVGGKLSELNAQGFRFDKGPSLFTMPGLVDDLFRKAKKNPRSYYQYQRLDPVTKYFFADKTEFSVPSDAQEFAEKGAEFFGVPSETISKVLKRASKQFYETKEPFLEKPIQNFFSIFTLENIPLFFKLPQFKIFQSLHQRNSTDLKNPKLIQMFDRLATYSGSSPFEASGILQQTAHLEYNLGAFLPEGGMYSIAKALKQLALDLGVEFNFNSKVTKINVHQGRIRSLKVGHLEQPYQTIICNADNHTAYESLLHNASTHIVDDRKEEPMSSAPLVFYWGMKGSFPQLDVHNILFSTDYKKEFDELFNENKAPIDPTIYINITSKVVPTDAPEGHENWFVMINVPPRDKKDNWFEKREQLRKLIIQKIQDRLGINVLDHLVFEDSLDPYTLEKSNGAYRGSIYGNRSVGAWSMFKRQPNQSPINGLYFVGGTDHPGGGIPLVLSSAKVTANLILDKDS